MAFTKLRGATLAQLDEVTANFTNADWEQLEDEHLVHIYHDVLSAMDLLGVQEDQDSVLVLCHLYRKLLARNPEIAS